MTASGRTKSKIAKYPRDMVGYGKRLPDPKWPGQARLAL
jgi:allantoinase